MFATKSERESKICPQDDQSCIDSAYAGSETMSEAGLLPTSHTSAQDRERSARQKSNNFALETQLKYNHDRHEISRSISEAAKVATNFMVQATNEDWPMQVPLANASINKQDRPFMTRTVTTNEVPLPQEDCKPQRRLLKRASTNLTEEAPYVDAEREKEPIVLSAEINRQLQILRPEIMMSAHEENIIHTMNPKAVGEIMKQQFTKVRKHLEKLHIRVEDTASKVLVTGDLNAGKSTFCNALLRQQVLPIDQQPCTEVFCEILDARENEDRYEVHAVLQNQVYDRHDQSTYSKLAYDELATAVQAPDHYSSLKVYVDDERPLSESLLRNGVVDISLIDAPGLNSDSLKTTAVYARQEEIDVIVFVVSAENHFTLSAKQFLWSAANEKAYLFIVVNRFDNIKDQDRCRRLILEQIAKLSPKTHADAAELVHFVSSAKVLERPEKQFADAFVHLETQLRNFVLDKRAQSKLAPAKNFVGKFWSDAKALAVYNYDIATEENIKLQTELLEVTSKLDMLTRDRQLSVDVATQESEAACQRVRQQTKQCINTAAKSLEALEPDYKYAGILDCYNFANALCEQYLSKILTATINSEMSCRQTTSRGVDAIRAIGLKHLDSQQYSLKPFNVQLMFSRKRDAIQRNLPVELNVLDFVDFANFEAIVGTSSLSAALVLYGGKTLGWSALVDTSFRVLNSVGVERTPKLLGLAAFLTVTGFGAFVLLQVPRALQKNVARKVLDRVRATDYADTNANRIANECRKVLQIPENELRLAFASKVEDQQRSKFAIEKQMFTATATIEFFKRQNQVIQREEKRLDRVML